MFTVHKKAKNDKNFPLQRWVVFDPIGLKGIIRIKTWEKMFETKVLGHQGIDELCIKISLTFHYEIRQMRSCH